MILFVWWIYFQYAVIPGFIVGWFIGKLALPIGWAVLLAICVSVIAALTTSFWRNIPGMESHVINLLGYLPPIITPVFLGVLGGRHSRQGLPLCVNR